MIWRPISILLALTAVLFSCNPQAATPGLSLEGGWVRLMPPGMKMTAAYGSFTNHGMDTIEISRFSSDIYASVSLHSSTLEDGVSEMKHLPGMLLTPGSSAVLKPGGLHLMLMNPAREVQLGDQIQLILIATDGEQYSFSLPVEAR